jgi:hypothetical protein
MSTDLRMAPQAEDVQRVSPIRQPQLTPAGGVGGPPSGDPQGQTPMDHDGHEMDSVSTPSPESQRSPSPNLIDAPSSSTQIPVSSDLSNETLTVVTEGLNQMEALTLHQGTGSADVFPEHTLVHAEAPPASAPPRGTPSKKPTSRPTNVGRVSRKKGEGSTRQKKRESPVHAIEDAQIPYPTVADKPQGALSPVLPSRRLSSIVVAPKG